MAKANNPIVFLDIAVSFTTTARIVIELYADTNPKTAENFRPLCTGEKGVGESGIPLHYQGSIIDSIVPGKIWHGGDTTQGNGLGGESIYGHQFPEEDPIRMHDRPGVLSLANPVGNPNNFKLLKLLRDAQVKTGELEAAMAKQTFAYQSKYVGDNAMGELAMAHCSRLLKHSAAHEMKEKTLVTLSSLSLFLLLAVFLRLLLPF